MFTVLVRERRGEQVAYTFQKSSVSVGRGQGNDIVLPRRQISDRHVSVYCRSGRFIITDLASTHGTWVRGRRLSQPRVVAAMEPVELGDFTMRCHLGGPRALDPPLANTQWPSDLMPSFKRLERLRELLYGDKTYKAWMSLCALLDEWPEDDDLAVALEYADELMESWPDEVRQVPDIWKRALLAGSPNPRFRLIRALELNYEVLEARVVSQLRWVPWLDNLRILSLRRSFMEDRELGALLELPQLTGLRWLDVSNNRISDRGLGHLAEASSMRELEGLVLSGNPIEGAGLPALVSSGHLARLKHLDLNDTWAGRMIPMALLAASNLSHLEVLNVAGNHLGPDGLQVLAQLPALGHLRRMEASHNRVGDEGMSALAMTPLETALRHLDLSHNDIGDPGALALANSPHFASLTQLNLRGNRLSDVGIEALASSPHLPNLDVLEV